MQNPRLAFRYAKSLLDLAVEKNTLEATLNDIRLIDSVCKQSREFLVMLQSPVINGDKKLAVLNAIISNSWQELTKAFVTLVVSKNRENFLPEIVTAFIEQYNEMHNIKAVKVTTAVPMNDNMKAAIMKQVLLMVPGSTVALQALTDENIVGGYIIETGGRLLDRSVRKQLNDMKAKVLDYSYVSQM